MFVLPRLGVSALVIVILMITWLSLILAGRHPLPLPNVGSRIFSAAPQRGVLQTVGGDFVAETTALSSIVEQVAAAQ